jgi:hypothetical protein
MHAILAGCVLAGMTPPALAAAAPADDATSRTLSYVFATELGSGVYEMSGRNLQVYRVIPSRYLRAPGESTPGVRVFAPITAGLYDFAPQDVIGEGLPTGVDSFSITPGIALDFELGSSWFLSPYVQAGPSFAGRNLDGWIQGAGLRLTRSKMVERTEVENRHELTITAVSWQHNLPNERFIRLRQAARIAKGTPVRLRGYELETGAYGIVDLILDSPQPAIADASQENLQLEFGLLFGTRPGFRIWRSGPLRLGIGYRLAGEISGLRLVLGSAF